MSAEATTTTTPTLDSSSNDAKEEEEEDPKVVMETTTQDHAKEEETTTTTTTTAPPPPPPTSTTAPSSSSFPPPSEAAAADAVITQSASFPSASASVTNNTVVVDVPALRGSSITVGHRSASGTMTMLTMNNTEQTDSSSSSSSNRTRANTAPPTVPTAASSSSSEAAATTTASTDAQPVIVHDKNDNKNEDNDDDDDEEIKLAMAMALAIQNNPNMTPDEIHQLVGGSGQQQQQQQKTTPTATTTTTTTLIPNRLKKAGVGGFNVFREKAVGRFTEMAEKVTATATTAAAEPTTTSSRGGMMMNLPFRTAATTTTTTTTNKPTTTTKTTTTTVEEEEETTVEEIATGTETKKEEVTAVAAAAAPDNQQQATTTTATEENIKRSNKPAAASSDAAVPSSSSPVPVVVEKGAATTSSTTTTTVESNAAAAAAAAATSSTTAAQGNDDDKGKKQKPSAATTATPAATTITTVLEKAAGTVATKVAGQASAAMNTLKGDEEKVTGIAMEATEKVKGMAAGAAKEAATTMSSSSEKGGLMKNMMMFKQQQQPTPSNNGGNGGSLVMEAPPRRPRLTGIAWKRRGGMGKFSATSAWERRRIALSGTRLLYYLTTTTAADEDSSSSNNVKDWIPPSTQQQQPNNTNTNSEQQQRRASWFETAVSSSWPPPSNATLEPEEATPRGCIDLAKEKATVNAAFGHSGAPTPFALSIKVKTETKWKLCFDRHSVCMEWLAAITDVVVQCSVDSYNAALLEAADPSNVSDFALFHPPKAVDGLATREGPGAGKEAHRLWMLERYRVQSDDSFDDGDDDDDDEKAAAAAAAAAEIVQDTTTTTVVEEEIITETARYNSDADVSDLDHKAAQESAREDATETLVLPQDHLVYAAAVMNLAILLARSSSTTVDGFWRIVVFGNLGVFLCLVELPDWSSILDRVRALPTTSSTTTSQQLVQKESAKKRTSAAAATTTIVSSAGELLLAPSVKAKSSYIPLAGSSAVKLDEPSDPPKNAKGEMFAGWRTMPGETLLVRSHGYADTKKKVPSPGELYECVAVDVFESPQRYPDMGPRVKLPTVDVDDGGAPKTWRSPDIFIISIALPTDPPKMGRSSSDGGGYTVTMYYRMKQETRDILSRVTADGYDPSAEKVDDPQKSKVNAVRLLEEWIRRSPSDPKFQARFKVVPNAHNLKEIGMPGWISKYNGKPFLIKRAGVTGFLEVHPELSCVEFDISLHPFPYLAKQGITFMKESYFKKVLVSFGFVIEGRADDELPECLIGLMQLCYPDPQYAIQAENFFNGTAPRSF